MPSLGELTITIRIEHIDDLDNILEDIRNRIHDIANKVYGKVGASEVEMISRQIAKEVVEAMLEERNKHVSG